MHKQQVTHKMVKEVGLCLAIQLEFLICFQIMKNENEFKVF